MATDSTSADQLALDLDEIGIRLLDLRRDVERHRHTAAELRGHGTQLVALDLSRVLVALGAANLALGRARRHTRLEAAP